jgi:3-hydroxyisobutyrate dehydrogenase
LLGRKEKIMGGQRIGFIGLGAMGEGQARNLVEAGFRVRGHDIDQAAVQRLVAAGGEAAGSPQEAAGEAELLLVLVFYAQQAEAVLFGAAGAVQALPRGATVVLHTTGTAEDAAGFEARLAETGHLMLDAPVTGGKAGAEAGTLTIIASGPEAAFQAACPAFEAMSSKVYRVGERAGAASTVKMINQLLVGIHGVAMAEAMVLAARAGADPGLVYDVITHGAGNSAIFERQVPLVLARDFAARGATEIMTKDLGAVTAAAAALRVPLPLTAAALQQYLASAAMGHLRDDTASVIKVYEALAQVDVAAQVKKQAEK